jgi:2-polyprenyl-3-methyl-5-hydroxy-6-metoxy-1,4-benzoquinol methylase
MDDGSMRADETFEGTHQMSEWVASGAAEGPSDLEEYAAHTYVFDSVVPPRLEELLSSTNPRSVADFGCGDGTLLMALRDRGLLDGRAVTGVEGSATRVDRLCDRWPQLNALVSDVASVGGLASESIDLVVSTQVIEHVASDQAMLNEMARVLRPGGSLYLTTVFKRWYAWYFYRCQGHWALDPTHVREYRADHELLPLLNDAGFEIVAQHKSPFRFPLVDPVLRRLKVHDASRPPTSWLRKLRLPIPGYRNWEIVARKTR